MPDKPRSPGVEKPPATGGPEPDPPQPEPDPDPWPPPRAARARAPTAPAGQPM
jgi:hypothetical protein